MNLATLVADPAPTCLFTRLDSSWLVNKQVDPAQANSVTWHNLTICYLSFYISVPFEPIVGFFNPY